MFFEHGFARRISILNDEEIVYSAMPSYLWQNWIFFGLVGGTIFAGLLVWYVRAHIYDRRYVSDYIFPVLLFCLAGLLIGRFVALATWITLLLFALEINNRFVIHSSVRSSTK